MKIESIIVILDAQSKVLESVGVPMTSQAMRELGLALEPARNLQTKAACARIKKAGSASVANANISPIKVGTALEQLRLLHVVLDAALAKSAGDIAMLIDALGPASDRPIQAIHDMLLAKPKVPRKAAVKSPAAELDSTVIRQIADGLASANGDDQKFKSLLGELKAQKLSKPAVSAIANRFLGVEANRTYKSVPLAFKRIEERHFQDAISASRGRAIDQINH